MVASVYQRRPLHVRVPRVTTRLARLAMRAAIFAALLLVMTILARRAGLVSFGELAAPLGVSGAGAMAAIVIGVGALADCWTRGAAGGWRAIRAIALALLVAVPFVIGIARYALNPPVRDVSTDALDPPPITATTDRPAATPPDLATRRYDEAIERVGGWVRAAVGELGWAMREEGTTDPAGLDDAGLGPTEITEVTPIPAMRAPTPEQRQLIAAAEEARREALAAERRDEEAVLTLAGEVPSPVLRLTSDVVVRLRDDGEQTTVDIRARSREGAHDFGRNAALARSFLSALDDAAARDGVTLAR